MKNIFLTLLFNCWILFSFGQYQIGIIPRVSPDKAIQQKIGYTELEIKYGSPSVNDRKVWGGIVPYEKVWRAGANNATTIEFQSDVIINNQILKGGKYSFFVIPKKNDKWSVIFNRESKQWGAFKYDSSEDALRIEISPRSTKSQTENMTYSIKQIGFKYGSIVLAWDFIELEIPFETNYLVDFEQKIESRAETQPEYLKWVPYIQGAEHLVELNSNLDLAKSWLDKAEGIMNSTSEWNQQFYPRDYVKAHLYWIMAKVYAKEIQYKEAIRYVDMLKSLANTSYYDKKNDRENIDSNYQSWNEGLNDGK